MENGAKVEHESLSGHRHFDIIVILMDQQDSVHICNLLLVISRIFFLTCTISEVWQLKGR